MELQPPHHSIEIQPLVNSLAEYPEPSSPRKPCIFLVANPTREEHPNMYIPGKIGVGPWHGPSFQHMEQRKLVYEEYFLHKINKTRSDIQRQILAMGDDLERCYDGLFLGVRDRDQFAWQMGMDVCFVLGFFLQIYHGDESTKKLDAMFIHDFVRVENQLPMILLRKIYNLATNITPSFSKLILFYFKNFKAEGIQVGDIRQKHFVDLLRHLMLPPCISLGNENRTECSVDKVYNVRTLLDCGVLLKVDECTSLLNVQFRNRTLTIPRFVVDDLTETYLRNILAFEDYYYPRSTHVADYLWVLKFLVETEEDVKILVKTGIIVYAVDNEVEVASIIKKLGTIPNIHGMDRRLYNICCNLNTFCDDPDNREKARIEREFFSSRRKIATHIVKRLLL